MTYNVFGGTLNIAQLNSMKFATESVSYISSHFKGAIPLHHKSQKTKTGKILLHLMQ